ncbi:MAG: M60 family metallopeptidase [Phycisphaerales bacterium]|nr:M60 family metallopeptidase [Phycisphaerales bacterium]
MTLRRPRPDCPPSRFPRRSHRSRPLRLAAALATLILGASAATAHDGAARTADPSAAAGEPTAADQTALLDGVKVIATVGTPGSLVCFGTDAFPVVIGDTGNGSAAVVAATRAGHGRIVAFGHGGYAGATTLAAADTGRLLENAVGWVANLSTTRRAPGRVGVWKGEGLEPLLTAKGFEVVPLPRDAGGWARAVRGLDVVCCFSPDLSPQQVEVLRRHALGGGGLVLGQTAWGWQQGHHDADVRTNPLNRLVMPFGLAWTSGTLSPTLDGAFDASGPPDRLTHGGAALEALVADADGSHALPAKERTAAAETVILTARFLPENERELRPRLEALAAGAGSRLVPTSKRPLNAERSLDRVLLAYQLAAVDDLPPSRVPAHPAAASFPGSVPADARSVARSVEVDLARTRWQSTGLYARPGTPVVVELPEGLAAAKPAVRIGCHKDELWKVNQWRRAPAITRSWSLTTGRNVVSSAFGGLIYIDLGTAGDGRVAVRIEGAVEAPRFVLGTTSVADWTRTIREAPGPWAELETSKVILTVPSSAVRSLDDPTPVLELWDRILDAAADLAAIPRERAEPQRYVADLQISAGYMHSGYPIMTHLDAVDDMTQVERLSRGAWGLFHELGHNHQDGMWTFGGTTEVTCNLFSLYIGQTVCGWGPREGHQALANREAKIARYRAEQSSFEKWRRDPFLALAMYQELQEAFGWDAFKNTFAAYRGLPKSERPTTDAAKRDQWMVRFSTTVGRSLAPFFDRWGVPVSTEAKASLADLPAWDGPEQPG